MGKIRGPRTRTPQGASRCSPRTVRGRSHGRAGLWRWLRGRKLDGAKFRRQQALGLFAAAATVVFLVTLFAFEFWSDDFLKHLT